MNGEFEAIERIRALLPTPPAGETWIGDDAAVLAGGHLLAIDTVVAGVHFDAKLAELDDVGWKAIAVNVSDIAAMGGRPVYCVVAVSGPAQTDIDLLFSGIAEAADNWGCSVVGGDLANAPSLVISVAMTGTTDGRPPVLRSGARPGDEIYVTGPLGGAAAGGYAWRPLARVAAGRVAAEAGATAMIDVSDGLANDLRHVAQASRVGIELDHVPIADGATLDQALGGGEDYELVFTAPDAAAVDSAFSAAGLDPPIPIGRCTSDGTQLPPPAGWEHSWRGAKRS